MKKNKFLGVLTIIFSITLTACGGGGGSSAPTIVIKNGVFKDSNVSGLRFVSGGESGVTNNLGSFTYEEGQMVTFSIGNVTLGSGMGKAIMTPVDLVSRGTLSSPEVINIARFLIMLDKDNMPSNGIEISPKVQSIANTWDDVDFTAADFPTQNVNEIITQASVEDSIVHTLPDIETATNHLRTTLLCASAGAYIGMYSGSESGNVALVVNPVNGEINGSTYNPSNQVSVELKNITALDYDMGLSFVTGEDSAKLFSGELSSTETFSGTWVNSANNTQNGTYSVNRVGGVSDAIYRYTVVFVGGDKGLFTFDVDQANIITGTAFSVSTNEQESLSGKLENNTLTVTTASGTKIDGVLDEETFTINGVWSNVTDLQAGSFAGGGCRLN